jgi:hypothetical protein
MMAVEIVAENVRWPASRRARQAAQEAKRLRLAHANALIEIIAGHGRRFFYSRTHDRVASMTLDDGGRVYYVDDYSGRRVYTSKPGSWDGMGFSHGGTLKDLVERLRDYISKGRLLPRWVIGISRPNGSNTWGYDNESMAKVRELAYALPIMESDPE